MFFDFGSDIYWCPIEKEGELLNWYLDDNYTVPLYCSKVYRSNQSLVCSLCKKDYLHHPLSEEIQGFNGAFLHKLCNGDLVKL